MQNSLTEPRLPRMANEWGVVYNGRQMTNGGRNELRPSRPAPTFFALQPNNSRRLCARKKTVATSATLPHRPERVPRSAFAPIRTPSGVHDCSPRLARQRLPGVCRNRETNPIGVSQQRNCAFLHWSVGEPLRGSVPFAALPPVAARSRRNRGLPSATPDGVGPGASLTHPANRFIMLSLLAFYRLFSQISQ